MKKVFSILFFISLVLTIISCGDRETAFERKIEEDRQNMKKVSDLKQLQLLKAPDEVEFYYPVMKQGFTTMIIKKIDNQKYNLELADGTYDSQYQYFIDNNQLKLVGGLSDFTFQFETERLQKLKFVIHTVRENEKLRIKPIEVFVNQETSEVNTK